jgi:hypothetical protein
LSFQVRSLPTIRVEIPTNVEVITNHHYFEDPAKNRVPTEPPAHSVAFGDKIETAKAQRKESDRGVRGDHGETT